MPMISSLANPQAKRVRRLQNDRRFRYREQAFVVEGTRLMRELVTHPQHVQALYYTPDWLADSENSDLLASAPDAGIAHEVSDEVMGSMSATETPPGVLAVASMRSLPLPSPPTLLLILDAVTNPGNLGAMLRTAAAAGTDAVLLGPGCVDLYNPKVVRGAMGAHFRLPIKQLDWSEIGSYALPVKTWLSDTEGDVLYADVDWRRPSALIISNEARGAGKEARALAHSSVAIPMARETESLNAAMASAVILFEAFRQRGFQGAENTDVDATA